MAQININYQTEKLVTETILDDYERAKETRNNRKYGMDSKGVELTFEEKLKNLKGMYYGERQPKNIPWRNCSNRSMKIAMAIIEMLHARMFPAVWNEDLVRWRPGEITDKAKVERINKLMDWWIRVWTKMKGFFDKWCKVTTALGDALTEVTWEIKKIPIGEEEIPVTDEYGMQLYEDDGTPSLTTQKKFKFEERTRTEIHPQEKVYFQEGQDDVQSDPVLIEATWTYSDLELLEQDGKAVNVSEPYNTDSKYLKDQLEEAISNEMGNVDEERAKILREVKLRSKEIDVIKAYRKIDIDGDGFPEDLRIIVDPVRRIFLGAEEVKDLSKRGKRPLDFTKVNDLLEDPDRLEGYGFLEMVKPLSDEIDAIFNQVTDSNTLSVLRPGFYDPAGGLVPQNMTLAPNKMIPVPDPSRNVYFPDFNIPTERLLVAMRTVMEFIERLTGASSYVMGKESEIVGGSGTATRTQAIVGAAEQRFAIPAQRLRAGASRILTIILDQVQKNIPPGMETRILGEDSKPVFKSNELTEDSIAGEFDAYLLEDSALGSMNVQRQLAIFLYQILLNNPIVATDPVKIYKETANLLKAHKEDPEEHLGPEPKQKDIDTPEAENTLMAQGDFEQVKALLTENHLQHIMKHQELLQSPTLLYLEPQLQQAVVQYAQMHIQEHMQLMQQLMMITGGQGGNLQRQAGNSQGVSNNAGMENIQEPFGSVNERKREGKSEFSPTT